MLIFKDVFSGDEVLSDAFPLQDLESKTPAMFEGLKPDDFATVVIKLTSRKITPNESGDVDIGCGSAFGGNNDDEAAAGPADANAPIPVIDVVHYFSLQQVYSLSKVLWKQYFMAFCKELKTLCEEKDKANGNDVLATRFKRNFPALKHWGLTTVYGEFDNYEFWMGKSADYPATNKTILIPAIYPDGAAAPDFYFMVDGLEVEKC